MFKRRSFAQGLAITAAALAFSASADAADCSWK